MLRLKRFAFFCSHILLLIFLTGKNSLSQNPEITVSGRATDAETGLPVSRMQIFNIRSGETVFSDSAGRFRVKCLKRDSLFFSSFGYAYRMVSFKDSAMHENYYVTLMLKKIGYELPNVTVYTKREFETIQHDAQKLGYNKDDYLLHGYEVLQSPITAMWQQFSRQEKDKRGYAQLMNNYRKNELVKEILRMYSGQGDIPVPDEEIDLFVDFCNVPESMLQHSSGYDIVRYMKTRLPAFESWLSAQKKKTGEK